jgi:hypothetical protein
MTHTLRIHCLVVGLVVLVFVCGCGVMMNAKYSDLTDRTVVVLDEAQARNIEGLSGHEHTAAALLVLPGISDDLKKQITSDLDAHRFSVSCVKLCDRTMHLVQDAKNGKASTTTAAPPGQ